MWLIISIVVGVILLYLKCHYNYWKNRGVDTPKYYYVFGNLLEALTFKRNGGLVIQDCYNAFQGYNYFGFYNMMRPAIIIRDPETIGNILIRDFTSFADNDLDVDEEADPIFGKNPFVLKGQRWKHVRAQSTPSFSSGKIKMMLPHIIETNVRLLKYMKNHENIAVDIDDLTKRISADNVASCAFGLEGGSFNHKDAEFVKIANEPVAPTVLNSIKALVVFTCPALNRFIKVSFFRKETVEYLSGIVKQTMKYRQENNIERNDFLDEMKRLNAKINDEKLFGFPDILGHAGGFILDGVITSSLALCHMLYEIARNDDVQNKLREEIEDVLRNDELTYEKIQDMGYLECVFKETLRIHPPLFTLNKRVTKPYTLPAMRDDNTGPKVQLEVGSTVVIPIYALHMDSNHFPEPAKFNPDRWNHDRKDNVLKNTYLPFGDGPRVCLGMRFAILQTKVAVITFVRNYNIKVNSKTQEPLKIDAASFLNIPIGGYWLEFSKI